MNTALIASTPVEKTATARHPDLSIWRRMFDVWVRSYDARVSEDGKVFFIGL
jgi:hypothetical protein